MRSFFRSSAFAKKATSSLEGLGIRMVAGFFIWNMDKDEFSAKLRNSVYKIIVHTQIFWCCGIILTYGEITLLRLGGVGGGENGRGFRAHAQKPPHLCLTRFRMGLNQRPPD